MAHAGGRPRKTTKDLPPNWKKIVIDMSAQGCSECEIRRKLVMPGKTFSQDLWDALEKRDKEFSLAIKESHTLCQAWWEGKGRMGVGKRYFQTALWFINMKNRFPDSWRDKVDVEHSGDLILNYGHRKEKSD